MHHYPPAPNSHASIVAPHMAVTGSYRDMLQADVNLSASLARAAEETTADAIAEWMASTGPARGVNRRAARLCIDRLHRANQVNLDAFSRFCVHVAAIRQAA